MSNDATTTKQGPIPSPFEKTQWTQVARAGAPGTPGAKGAMEYLAGRYWQPVFIFLRKSGHSKEDAEDLTQGFFARFFGKCIAGRADRELGRFRNFLLKSVKNYAENQRMRDEAKKRGGGAKPLPLEEVEHLIEIGEASPDESFDRRWAALLLDRARKRTADWYAKRDKEDLYLALQQYGRHGPMSGEQIAASFGMSENAVKKAAHDMRARLGKFTREEIALTLGDDQDINDEVEQLSSLF